MRLIKYSQIILLITGCVRSTPLLVSSPYMKAHSIPSVLKVILGVSDVKLNYQIFFWAHPTSNPVGFS